MVEGNRNGRRLQEELQWVYDRHKNNVDCKYVEDEVDRFIKGVCRVQGSGASSVGAHDNGRCSGSGGDERRRAGV